MLIRSRLLRSIGIERDQKIVDLVFMTSEIGLCGSGESCWGK